MHEFEIIDPNCAGATNNTWIGPTTGHWHENPSFWSRDGIPKACDNVVIPSGYVINVLNGNTAECNTISVSHSAELHVQPFAELKVQHPN